ncbi:hypothetical protein QE365_001902 [Acinetobacter baylyi]|uniref:hypothetical protein n=1 Tax=Acinetobacter baylyi TaxID=202950 RepID=UPI00285B042E|nr:hypothetical protein [Acinetobacter baylyi]MDR6106628.1 hypothetical protein [Acinetobacter baylyi]
MGKQELIDELLKFKKRLDDDVYQAYANKGSEFGGERFSAWERAMYNFLEKNLPSYKKKLYSKLNPPVLIGFSNQIQQFHHDEYNPSVSFIDSLILDIENNEIEGKI